jgi:hypothetical protein
VVDFRYHALSLVAVFLALGVGLLMGVAVGDSGLASTAREALRDGLRGDLTRARGELARRERFEQRAYPALVAGRLRGVRVRVVADGAVAEEVRAAVEAAGGEIVRGEFDALVVTRTSSITPGGRRIVGVELSGTQPSSVGRFRERGISSVDDVDRPSGKVALVLLLAGKATGAYGEKPGAADLVPDALGAR